MILQKLCEYYDRLAADPEANIAPPGAIVQGVAFEVVIKPNGELVTIGDLRDTSGKSPRPRPMILPGASKPSGSGLNPSLNGWDRTDYMLGYLNPDALKDHEREKKLNRCREAHDAFRTAMLEREPLVGSPAFSAFCRFLEAWRPENAAAWPVLAEASGAFGVVRIAGQDGYLHDDPGVGGLETGADAVLGGAPLCLVSGVPAEIARTHEPKIKGVNGAQSSGAAVVSFNSSAFTSFGKDQSFNAPVSAAAAFKYATALNKLLTRDGGHRVQVGDTTCTFWADAPSPAESLFAFAVEGSGKQAEDADQVRELELTFQRIRDGDAPAPDTEVGFHVLGLAPNAARLAIRFWYSGTVGELLDRVMRHQRELEIVRSAKDRNHLPLWLLLRQTARETKEIPPLLGGALLRSVLTGGPYPEALLAAVIRRLRVDHAVSHPRAAVIRAVLNRNHHQEVPVALDETRPESAYQLGRLFAALEKAQEDALPGINATIKDRFFSAASATPGAVFPRLIRMNQHHVGKLEGGRKVVAEKRIQSIVGRIDQFPSHLDLVGQGLFSIGYYHQRQDFFTKKNRDTQD